MAGRRILYCALLLGAAVLHFAYGQYVTHYVLLFLLLLPVFSLLISLPAILSSRADMTGCEDVCRGRAARVRLNTDSSFVLPPNVWKFKIEYQNLFTESEPQFKKVRICGNGRQTEDFSPDTSMLGTIRYRIRSARACDYLGLIAIPIKKGSMAVFTVMPDFEAPVPEPELIESSSQIFKPKPMGFSEEHELRPYREGDAVNLIHWKLTQKYDETIVREPQEVVRKGIVIVVDLPGTYPRTESLLEQLRYINDKLMHNGLPYLLHIGERSMIIRSIGELEQHLKLLLSEPIHRENASPAVENNDTIVYRILPRREVR